MTWRVVVNSAIPSIPPSTPLSSIPVHTRITARDRRVDRNKPRGTLCGTSQTHLQHCFPFLLLLLWVLLGSVVCLVISF